MALLQRPSLTLKSKSTDSPLNDGARNRSRSRTFDELRSKSHHRIRRKSKTPKGTSSHHHKFKRAPKKLGPRDIGRIKYKGTKYKDRSDPNFLSEKLNFHARSSSFQLRKIKNPVEKKKTVEETGTPNDWHKPKYYKSEVQKMYSYHNAKRRGWGGSDALQFLQEKPSKPKDSKLEALKDTHLPKGQSVRAYGSPNAWKPIAFKFEKQSGGFLDEKFWFESSHVQIDGGLSKLIECLPAKQQLKLKKMAAPTGYQSKINYLKHLRDLVMTEVKRLHKEDEVIKKMEDSAFINGLSADIEEEFDKELDEVMDELLDGYDDNGNIKTPKGGDVDVKKEKKTKKKGVRFAVVDDVKGDKDELIVETDLSDAERRKNQYKSLVRRKRSDAGMLQRKLLTMQSVNKLTNLIDDMEAPQQDY